MSETAKHTPGEWRVEEGTTLVWGNCAPGIRASHAMGYPIVDCRISNAARWAKGPDADEGEANARLVAAAPDMLEALKEINRLEINLSPDLWARIVSAITKATGSA